MAEELDFQMSLSANSTEVIELARRPSADKGKTQYGAGRAIRYVDSEMRVTDALQAACAEMKSYKVSVSGGAKRLVRVISRDGDYVGGQDLDESRASFNAKLRDLCHERAEEVGLPPLTTNP